MTLARELGAELGVTHTINFRDPDSARNAHFSQALRMGLAAGGGHVALTIENSQYNWKKRMAYLDYLSRLTNYAQTRGCCVTFDTCHAGAGHEDILQDYERVKPLLRNVHLSDLIWRNGLPRTHVTPGDGALPLRELLARLARDDYDGLVTVELHPREVGLLSRARAERALGRALDLMRATIATASAAQAIEQA
jgi:sugar phosphate isomerase/epimerase